ncbi:EAL domain-containing protein [Parasphingopyxis marina]|uniref:EAL domain-containing protein n=1 Tax=Parasphingopyxis marina TaxID=2761622 RepID=A0A842HXG4_9SPHN|nr:EAL domain-containing protein [Parasphingopyxis marina]MBC2777796.1 EAL domain-containing protein [Parasphingopyxis marina]
MLGLKRSGRDSGTGTLARGSLSPVLWAATISLLIGLTGFGEPLDLALSGLRNKMRSQPVSGEIVAVGIDRRALRDIGGWPWDGETIAALNDSLFEAGARRVYYNFYFQSGEVRNEPALIDSVGRFPGRVFVASSVSPDPRDRSFVNPSEAIAEQVEVVSISKWITFWNGVESVPYRMRIAGVSRPSMEAAIADISGEEGELFRVDYSYSVASIPYWSAEHFVQNEGPLPDLTGRDVVVGGNDETVSDYYSVLGQRPAAGLFVTILGAETLKAGRPAFLGWISYWAFCFALFLAWRNQLWSMRTILTCLALLPVTFLGTTLLETINISAELAPTIAFVLIMLVWGIWARMGRRKKSEGTINPISGLPTFNAALHDEPLNRHVVVGAHFDTLAEIVSALPAHLEAEVTSQVVNRLQLGIGNTALMHGDDGNFCWFVPAEDFDRAVTQFSGIHALFRNPVLVDGKQFDTNVTFGIDRDPAMPLSHRITSVLAAAREAMSSGVLWIEHDREARPQKEWGLAMIGELESAISRGEMRTVFQPQIDLLDGRIMSAEALVRWKHPVRGEIGPGEFIALAEQRGRIKHLTTFVLDQALEFVAEARKSNPDFTVAVNLSVSLLNDDSLIELVLGAIRQRDLSPSCLTLEITETAPFKDKGRAAELLARLTQMGVRIAIDDYGAGQSSLDYFRELPVHEIKIDRSFVQKLPGSEADEVLVKSIIDLSHALSKSVTAEGVEEEEALELLKQFGCDRAQGYLIGFPMSPGELLDTLSPGGNRASA